MAETIIVGIVVGAFSGVLGSVLGPYIGHRLSRSQRREQRAEQRQRELRTMLEDRMQDARRKVAGFFKIRAYISVGLKPVEAYLKYLEEERAESRSNPKPIWRPYRIDDEALKSLAMQLHDLDLKMMAGLGQVSERNRDDWWKSVTEMEKQLQRLEEEIDLRLDVLEW